MTVRQSRFWIGTVEGEQHGRDDWKVHSLHWAMWSGVGRGVLDVLLLVAAFCSGDNDRHKIVGLRWYVLYPNGIFMVERALPKVVQHYGNEVSIMSNILISTTTSTWVRLSNLPPQMYNQGYIESIVNSFGRFLAVDYKTITFINPSFARVCIELDVSKTPPEKSSRSSVGDLPESYAKTGGGGKPVA
ncbi:hypothetical protein QQ045_001347 [Rhodiola kirilowii]